MKERFRPGDGLPPEGFFHKALPFSIQPLAGQFSFLKGFKNSFSEDSPVFGESS